MNIALDVMGGDHAPSEVVLGAVRAARDFDITVSLVGKPDVIRKELARHDTEGLRLPIIPASQVIEMDDKPANAVRAKPDNSMSVGCKLVRSGDAHGFVTAGNTGGALAAGILHVGRIKGILRPALISPIPTHRGYCVMLDIGANADVRPEYFPQFAIMGSLYAEVVLGLPNPRVRVLSNGEEEGKGSQLVIAAAQMLGDTPGIRFEGNIESKEVFQGVADVVVTDGFTGNIFLKTAESSVRMLQTVMVEEIKRRLPSKVGGLLIRSAMRRVKARLDDSETGGAVLLGLSGIVVVAHGRAKSNAIRSAIRVAKQAVEHDLPGKIQVAVERDSMHAGLGLHAQVA
jgi:glycerol-3-phosphate acyltransferase PlsX